MLIHDTTKIEHERYCRGKDRWITARLIEMAKPLPVFQLPLAAVDLTRMPWDVNDLANFILHVRRCMAVDLRHPVILCADGSVMNGWHRIVRAVILGREFVPAVRFVYTPSPDFQEDN